MDVEGIKQRLDSRYQYRDPHMKVAATDTLQAISDVRDLLTALASAQDEAAGLKAALAETQRQRDRAVEGIQKKVVETAVEALQQEAARLREQLREGEAAYHRVGELNDRLREALQYYADPAHWGDVYAGSTYPENRRQAYPSIKRAKEALNDSTPLNPRAERMEDDRV